MLHQTTYNTPYTPAAHYWHVAGDDSRAWSSARREYVATDDAEFAAWRETPGRYVTRIASEAELRDVLTSAGFPDRAPGYVPQKVSLWQAREALRIGGHFAAVDAAIQAFGGAPLAAWEYGTEVRRDAPLIDQMALILKLSEADVDALFVLAASLEV